MVNDEQRLFNVTEVAVIAHPRHGVLLLHSADRGWHFPDCTLSSDDSWQDALLNGVRLSTGLHDVVVENVLRIETFRPGVVGVRAHYGVFFSCSTAQADARVGPECDRYAWVADGAELGPLESDLFHPMVKDLVLARLQAR